MKRRKIISGEMVRQIVRNPVYRGVVRVRTAKSVASPGTAVEWEEYRGRHKPIVSARIWRQANELLFGKRAKRAKQ